MKNYLGIDVGSISSKFVLIDETNNVLFASYFRTDGEPIKAIQSGLKRLKEELNFQGEIAGVGTTGSARYLAGVIVGADLVKNEITAHARGVSHFIPDVKTIIDIGGQDSKIIILEKGVVVDFALNLLCAAGCGAFLDAQAHRLGIPIENFGETALKSKSPTSIGSRCTVFSESDMIHKQQVGHAIEDIVAGLCQGLVRNYLNNVAKGKKVETPIVFEGGVSENTGIIKAFEEGLKMKIIVPKYNKVMGALGAALLVKEQIKVKSQFRGFQVSDRSIKCTSFKCNGCPNQCEIIEARLDDKVIARWGDRCEKWSSLKV